MFHNVPPWNCTTRSPKSWKECAAFTNVAGRLVSARATGATTPSPYPCHSPVSCGPVSQWSGVNCFKMHTKLEPTVRLELSEKLSMDWRRSKKSSSHWIIEMWILKGTKVLHPSTISPNRNSTNNKVGHIFHSKVSEAVVLTQADFVHPIR